MLKIPKIIHYVWVGEKPLSDEVLRCIESWRKYCPDYEIKCWGNEEYEKHKNLFSTQAYKYKKWAFVADYLRLVALITDGGIYLDTDVELTHGLDEFLENEFFVCFEDDRSEPALINSGLIGATKNNKIIKKFLNFYKYRRFVTYFGLRQTANTAILTKILNEMYGLNKKFDNKTTLNLEEKAVIYPYHYFCTPIEGEQNFAIHNFSESWVEKYKRRNFIKMPFGYTLAGFKGDDDKEGALPLYGQEKIIWQKKTSLNKYLVLIKS